MKKFKNLTWEERAEVYQRRLDESKTWAEQHWNEIPEGVRMIILRGQDVYEEKVDWYKEKAKQEAAESK